MAGMIQVQGVSNLISKLKQKSDQFAKGTELGVLKAGLFLQRQSQMVAPVDTGNMRASAFTRKEAGTSGFKTVVKVGYIAAYAIYVHENLNAQHKPGKMAKFLEQPFRENRKRLVEIIKEEAARGSSSPGASVAALDTTIERHETARSTKYSGKVKDSSHKKT